MTTCWALWQRMPPRYQLTSRGADDNEPLADDRNGSPRLPRTPRTPRVSIEPAPGGGKRPTIAGGPPTGSRTSSNNRRFNFPNRRSGYIDHFKTQQRVNSARIKFMSDSVSSIGSQPSQERASTAPSLSVQESSLESTANPHINFLTQGTNEICSQHKASLIKSLDNDVQAEKKTVSYNDEGNTNTRASETAQVQRESSQRRFNVRETEEGTMYIDNGKIIFFKKSRHDPSILLKAKSTDGGFLASIRREYLKKPKYLSVGNKNYVDERLLQRERVYYNQKVGHILDYYSRVDEDMLSMDDITRYTRLTDHALPPSARTPRSTQIRRLYVGGVACSTERVVPNSCTNSNTRVIDEHCSNSYMKVHRQLKLHDRKFYLRTPGMRSEPSFQQITPSDIENCKCGMCKIELQLSLMSQLGITAPLKHLGLNTNSILDQSQMQEQTESGPEIGETDMDANEKGEIDFESKTQQSSKEDANKSEKSADVDTRGKQQEHNLITVNVPGMKLERDTTDMTMTDSFPNTSRTLYSKRTDDTEICQ